MPPKPHGTQRRIIGATWVGEIKCHGPCTAPEPQRCNLRFAREPLEIGKHGPAMRPPELRRSTPSKRKVGTVVQPAHFIPVEPPLLTFTLGPQEQLWRQFFDCKS